MVTLNTIFTEALGILFYHLAVLLVPGPNFILVSRNSIMGGKKAGIVSALGITVGILLHAVIALNIFVTTYSYPTIFRSLRFVGSVYLIYLGYKFFFSHFSNKSSFSDLQNTSPFRTGFFLEITNPFISFFYLSLFTYVFGQKPYIIQGIVAIFWIAIIVFSWFALEAIVFSRNRIQKNLLKHAFWIRAISGGLMLIYAILLLLKD